MIRKLDGGGGGGCGWLRERVREIEIRGRSGKYSYIILYYFNVLSDKIKVGMLGVL